MAHQSVTIEQSNGASISANTETPAEQTTMSNNEQSMDNCINKISFSEFLTQDEIAIINQPIINSNDVIDKARIFRPISMQATALSRKVIEVPSNQIPCNNLLQQVTIQMQQRQQRWNTQMQTRAVYNKNYAQNNCINKTAKIKRCSS